MRSLSWKKTVLWLMGPLASTTVVSVNLFSTMMKSDYSAISVYFIFIIENIEEKD